MAVIPAPCYEVSSQAECFHPPAALPRAVLHAEWCCLLLYHTGLSDPQMCEHFMPL